MVTSITIVGTLYKWKYSVHIILSSFFCSIVCMWDQSMVLLIALNCSYSCAEYHIIWTHHNLLIHFIFERHLCHAQFRVNMKNEPTLIHTWVFNAHAHAFSLGTHQRWHAHIIKGVWFKVRKFTTRKLLFPLLIYILNIFQNSWASNR